MNLALVLRAQERFEEAAECLQRACVLGPDYDADGAIADDLRLARLLKADVVDWKP